MSPVGAVEVRAATADSWEDISAVLGNGRRGADSCWCRRFLPPSDLDNRTALHHEVRDASVPVGLIAYLDGEPSGWSRVAPRSALPGVLQNRALQRLLTDDPDAWWITCFVVRPAARGHRLSGALLGAGVDLAREGGASVLDGHPVDVRALAGSPSPAALFTGVLAVFEKLGFQEVGRTYPTRPVMRWSF